VGVRCPAAVFLLQITASGLLSGPPFLTGRCTWTNFKLDWTNPDLGPSDTTNLPKMFLNSLKQCNAYPKSLSNILPKRTVHRLSSLLSPSGYPPLSSCFSLHPLQLHLVKPLSHPAQAKSTMSAIFREWDMYRSTQIEAALLHNESIHNFCKRASHDVLNIYFLRLISRKCQPEKCNDP
jgi:hypothetical protein